MGAELVMRNLHVSVEGNPILKGLDLTVRPGEVHSLMGPNGSGKSTLAYALMGHPFYEVDDGEVLLNGENLLELEPDERARKGLFLAFQYPTSIPGVSVADFLRTAVSSVRLGQSEEGRTTDLIPMREFRKEIRERMTELGIDHGFARRHLNDGFSGGEKKRAEILQMALLKPRIAVLDETDSGLDIDALRAVADGVNRQLSSELGVLLITHYQRILNYIEPHFVHIMVDGRIVRSGGPELAHELEAKGYDMVKELVEENHTKNTASVQAIKEE
ncbi:MAG: Fe-S cluster assembly ATPase SufC [Candidatus Tectimicrobiota bacterium]